MCNIKSLLLYKGPHPFHLHGHAFQVVGRGQLAITNSETFPVRYGFDYSVLSPLDSLVNPLRRDTVTVPGNGYAILRFVADNPGGIVLSFRVSFL